MRNHLFTTALLAGAIALGGACEKDRTDLTDDNRVDVRDNEADLTSARRGNEAEATRPDVDVDVRVDPDTEAKARAAADEARDDLNAARDTFVRESRERLAAMDRRIDELEAKSDAEASKRAAQLRAARDEIRADLDRAEDRASSNWQQFKTDVDARWEQLKTDLDETF
jgi:hypothetical protein